MNIDLENLSLKELRDLQSRVTKAVTSYEDRHKKKALAALDAKAKELGFSSLAELTGTRATRKRAPAVPKYANPADTSETWSGRGRKPRWFVAALKKGRTPEDLAI
ncbi:H-NS histone family protein [Pseudorhodobacter sp.]|uniref:H-NS histone family protein n=1 Tax=Pseudorhodobacter sp. TaxID=1934400 RepID=UPI0026489952|nr:H-NS histone family protein [Pseudorhodobacter sp.]MDN5787919.1 H-NS histone family protein [Pseudorhodobacter sp.]